MTSALAQKRSHVLPQDVSTVLDFLAQDIQELHALEKKSLTRESIKIHFISFDIYDKKTTIKFTHVDHTVKL
jgi:hypothetical protein